MHTTDPFTESRFVEDWTIFYWAWWVAVGPFMGVFIADISRGRTIRQTILGTLVWGSLGCTLFYGILGNYALYLENIGALPVMKIVAEDGAPAAIIRVVESLPFAGLVLPVFCVISLIFLATTFDSTSYTLAICATRELPVGAAPARWQRLFWAFTLAILPTTLMFLGELQEEGQGTKGLEALKTAVLVVSLPLLAVYALIGLSICRMIKDRR